MKLYDVMLTGEMPLLMHADNIEWADRMGAWKDDPKNKANSRAGDDRTPAHRWIGCLYHDGQRVAIPQDMIMACVMKAGGQVPVPGAKHGKTFRAQTQSGMMLDSHFWAFEGRVGEIPMANINALLDEPDFARHRAFAHEAGFDLFLKRAKIGMTKHIRVRPRFDAWSVYGRLKVWDEKLTEGALKSIFDHAGQYVGLGDWRPGGKTPGPFGMFSADLSAVV